MHSYIREDTPTSVYVTDLSNRSLSAGPVSAPVCTDHGKTLTAVSEVPELTLREGRMLAACPECFGTGYERDTEALLGELADAWDTYGQHFEEQEPPADKSMSASRWWW